MAANIGVAGAFGGISQGINQGLMNAYNIRKDTQKLAQNQQLFDRQMQSYGQQDKEKDLQIQQMQMQIKAMENKQTKQDTYDAFSGYRESGDTKFLNQAMVDNPKLKTLSNGIIRFDNLHPEADKGLMESAGLTAKQYTADPSRYTKVTKDDGSTVIMDMNAIYAGTGYLKTLKKEELDALALRAQKANTSVAETKATDLETYMKENPDKTYQDYLNSGKAKTTTPPTLGQVEAQDFLKWKQIPGNENKTVTEYKAQGAPEKSARRDTLKQLTEAQNRLNDAKKAYSDNPTTENAQKLKDAKAINTRLQAGQGQIRENTDVQDSLNAKDIAKDITKYSDKDRANAEEQFVVSNNYKPYAKQHKEFLDSVVTVENTDRLKKQLDKLIDSGSYKSDFFNNLSNTIKKYTPADWKKLSKEDVDKIAIEAKVDKNTAAILKNISGTAASDQEFARTLGYTIGQMNYDEKTKQVIFNSSYEKLKNDTIEQGKQLVEDGLVGATYDKLKSIGGDVSSKENGQIIKPTLDPSKPIAIVKNSDGTTSTVRTIGIEVDGKNYVIPTVSKDGRIMSNEEAVKHFKETGEHFGAYKTRKEADQAAEELHKSQSHFADDPKQYTKTATNPKTGERIGLTAEGKWELIK